MTAILERYSDTIDVDSEGAELRMAWVNRHSVNVLTCAEALTAMSELCPPGTQVCLDLPTRNHYDRLETQVRRLSQHPEIEEMIVAERQSVQTII